MRKLLAPSLAIALAAALLLAPSAQGAFGLKSFDVTFTNEDGSPDYQAGSHPFAMTTSLAFNTRIDPRLGEIPDDSLKDLDIAQIAGFIGNQTAVPTCTTLDFLAEAPNSACALDTEVGTNELELFVPGDRYKVPVYNLVPPPGVAAKLGFWAVTVPVTIEVGVRESPPYNLAARVSNAPQAASFYSSKLTLWGTPADPAHDSERLNCHGSCAVDSVPKPFLTMPRACPGSLVTSYQADSWGSPGARLVNGEADLSDPNWLTGAAQTHDSAGNPLGFLGCSKLGFSPSITAQPTTKAASSPTGLDFSLDVSDEGLANPSGLAQSDIRKAVVTLPEGFSTNPSIAEGLSVCSQAQLDAETAFSAPGVGCPDASKVGTVEVESPLVDESIKGALYIAKPYENEFGSLLALYVVIKNPILGIVVKQALKVEPNPVTGQLTTVAEDLPQLPFSHFKLHFREGARSPLVSPSGCGAYDGHDATHQPVKAELTPWSGGAQITTTSTFEIFSGPDNSPCPTGGLPSFHPQLSAGTLNNAAGKFSPFNVKLTRSDSEQEFTNFSIKLPPGVAGKLAGIPFCSDAAIAQATARTGPHGGQEEIDAPSCPAASYVGRTLAGAGVGPSLAYAPGKLYLAGPYHGAPLSIVSITAGVVGPFDIGTVVVRLAVRVNPETAEVFLDSTGSDPIPHIIKGIPLHLRDIRAYTDRPEFTYNPTSCEPTSTAATVLGSGLDFVSVADDNPFVSTSRFQAADCASLGYKPKLSLRLRGSTKRGGNPALRAVLAPRPGDANSAAISVALPHSEFLEQGHIRTICTRVQFNAGAGNGAGCPAESIYGHAKAWTPILAEPLEGPIFLRSSEHPLPDLVLALHGLIDFNAVGRIDSVNGGIRNTFDLVPDAPISKVVVDLQGGKKSLLANSRNLCKSVNRATAEFKGQNGKQLSTRPILKVKCGKKAKKKHKGNKRHARAAR